LSYRRILNNKDISLEFRRQSVKDRAPDVVIASYPLPSLAYEAVRYGEKTGVPVVVDVRDMWPDTIAELVPAPARPLAKLSLRRLFAQAKYACKHATALSAHTEGFLQWALAKGQRERAPLDRYFPFGYQELQPVPEEIEHANAFWKEKGLDPAAPGFLAVYVGVLGVSSHLADMIDAARKLQDLASVNIVIAGSGDQMPKLKERAAGLKNVLFPGWLSQPQIYTLLRMASVGVAPYLRNQNFLCNIPNKVPEYLSAGLPIVSTLKGGEVGNLIEAEECGIAYAGGATDLAGALRDLATHPDKQRAMSENAARLFINRFRAENVYTDMIDHLQHVAHSTTKPRL
jgi:glycosyltransferase involved in cell wall biosynthesis